MTTLTFPVTAEEHGRQVRAILRAHGVSRKLLNMLKRTPGGLCVNGGTVIRTDTIVNAGDILVLHIPADIEILEPLAHPLNILYEDEHILVVDKPPTLPMHPSHNHQGDTLANAVAAYKQVTFRAVGRLDRGTSGVVVVCLHSFAAAKLNLQRVAKTYYALAHGSYTGSGTFRNTIYRPDPMCIRRACRDYEDVQAPGDETAVTHWSALAGNGELTYLRMKLETGRTHQIRVHFAHHGTPLAGDDMYGAPKRNEPGHFLHCGQARLVHPVTDEHMVFHAPLPPPMQNELDLLLPLKT